MNVGEILKAAIEHRKLLEAGIKAVESAKSGNTNAAFLKAARGAAVTLIKNLESHAEIHPQTEPTAAQAATAAEEPAKA